MRAEDDPQGQAARRDLLTTSLELVGLSLVVAGVWLIFVPAAFIVAGAGLLAMSYVETRGKLR